MVGMLALHHGGVCTARPPMVGMYSRPPMVGVPYPRTMVGVPTRGPWWVCTSLYIHAWDTGGHTTPGYTGYLHTLGTPSRLPAPAHVRAPAEVTGGESPGLTFGRIPWVGGLSRLKVFKCVKGERETMRRVTPVPW